MNILVDYINKMENDNLNCKNNGFWGKNSENSTTESPKTGLSNQTSGNIGNENAKIAENTVFSTNEVNLSKKNTINAIEQGIFVPNKRTSAEETQNNEKTGATSQSQVVSEEGKQSAESMRYNIDNLFSKSQISSFNQAFPNQSAEKLQQDKDFCSFVSILGQNPSLLELYGSYTALVSSIEKKAMKKAAQQFANEKCSVGSLSSTIQNGESFFSKEQVMKMSPEQIKRNYVKIRESQQNW